MKKIEKRPELDPQGKEYGGDEKNQSQSHKHSLDSQLQYND